MEIQLSKSKLFNKHYFCFVKICFWWQLVAT